MEYHIACCTDSKYAAYCGVMLHSLFANNKGASFYVHILIEDLDLIEKERIERLIVSQGSICLFHEVPSDHLDGVKIRARKPLSKAAYYRVLLPTLLSEDIHRVLYLDCDIIVLRDITSIFRLDIHKYALAAIRDVLSASPVDNNHRLQLNLSYNSLYFNSGFMLINLDYWREHQSERSLLEFSKRDRQVYYHDQDALNYVFKDKWFVLSPQWCYMNLVPYNEMSFINEKDFRDYKDNPIIIHYCADTKPWHNVYFSPQKALFLKYKKETDWKNKKALSHPHLFKAYFRIVCVSIVNNIYTMPCVLKYPLKILFDLLFYFLRIISKGKIIYRV